MTIDDKIRDKNFILTENCKKYQRYHQVNLINMNILQVKKYCLLTKDKGQNNLGLHVLHQEKLFKNKEKRLKRKEKNKQKQLKIREKNK